MTPVTSGLHRDITLGSVHLTHNWEYADQTAREAATGFVAGDVKKLALQLDDFTLWMLTDDSPVTWQAFGATGEDGTNGTDGTDGVGVPPGGSTGDILAKIDGTDYNTEWVVPSGGSGHTIQEEGNSLTARSKLNFVGAGVSATDDAGNDATIVTIAGGGGGGGALALQTLTDEAMVAWDCSAGNGIVTLGGNRTMDAPSDQVAGQTYMLYVVQDGTGSRTLTWNAVFKWLNSSIPVLAKSSGSVDVFEFFSDGTNLYGKLLISNAKAGPLIPTDIDGCQLWLKADAITGKSNGVALSQWDDSSGLGHHATQATGGAQPLYETNVLNGLPVVRFDATNDAMGTTAVAMGAASLFVVCALASHTAPRAIVNGTNGWTFGCVADNWILYSASHLQGTTVIDATFYVFSMVQGSIYTMWQNGSVYVNSITNQSIGCPGIVNLGKLGGNAWVANADVAEVILYDRELTTAERVIVENYLKAKYNL